jgi:hypothetical protein
MEVLDFSEPLFLPMLLPIPKRKGESSLSLPHSRSQVLEGERSPTAVSREHILPQRSELDSLSSVACSHGPLPFCTLVFLR